MGESVVVKRFGKAGEAIRFLEALALDSPDMIVFRGHHDEEFRLKNSWQRHCAALEESANTEIGDSLAAFRAGMIKLGITHLEGVSRLEELEHGRHHGVPIPCLDFSYSPYVGLFFAFNSVPLDRSRDANSVILALNIDRLARLWARSDGLPPGSPDHERAVERFRNPGQGIFDEGFPVDTLQFIPFPGRYNRRMQRQLGCLLYDTLWYRQRRLGDLEDFIQQQAADGGGEEGPILTKVLISQSCVAEVFSRLELMNITGGNLYDSPDGVAMDITNAYHYNPKFSYLRR